VVYDGVVYVLGPSLFALDAETGEELWSFPIQRAQSFKPNPNGTKWHYWSEWSSPTIAGDRVYVVSSLDNSIIVLDRTPGDGIDDGHSDPAEAGYDVIWRYKVPDENIFGSRSSPIVVNDILYVGTAEGDLIAFHADPVDRHGKSTGLHELLWSYRVGTRIDSSPAYHNDVVYIGTWDIRNKPDSYEFNESDTYLYAFDSTPAEDGVDEKSKDPEGSDYDLLWRQQLGDLIWSSPTINTEEGIVYIGCSDGKIYAFDSELGTPLWNHSADAGGPVYGTAAIHGNIVLFGSSEPTNSLFALNSTTGERLWRFQANEKVGASPVIVGDTVYQVVMDGRVYALDLEGNGDGTTSILDTTELPDRLRGTPAVSGGRIYLSCWDGNLYALGTGTDGSGEPLPDIVISAFSVIGDSEEANIDFAILNQGEGDVINSTLLLYSGRNLLYLEEVGAIQSNLKFWFSPVVKDLEPRKHLFKVQLNYTDITGEDKIYLYEVSVDIEKHHIPSFIPALGTGAVLITILTAAVVKKRHRRS
jgi:outer membrane protein assembly factor BamB